MEHFFTNTHKNNIRHLVIGSLSVVLPILIAFKLTGVRFEYNIRFELVEHLVVTEVAVFWQVQDWHLFEDLVVFVVIHLNEALSDKKEFFHVAFVAYNCLAGCVNPTVHIDDKLIDEATFALFEKVLKLAFELAEDARILDQVGLHLGCDLLEEWELLDHEVEVKKVRLLYIFSDIIVQHRLNMEWFV